MAVEFRALIIVEAITKPGMFKEVINLKKKHEPRATDNSKSITQMLLGTQTYSDGRKIAQLVSGTEMACVHVKPHTTEACV